MDTIRMRRQCGAVAVEFALIASMLILVLLGIIGFGHWLFTLEMVAEATREGARVAVVCNLNDSAVKAAIQARLPQLSLTDAQVSLQYVPAGCTQATCQSVTVSLSGVTYAPWIPIGPGIYPIPPFTTSLPRESLQSVNSALEVNPVCT
jgi:Flp pilus assembly protein TadG